MPKTKSPDGWRHAAHPPPVGMDLVGQLLGQNSENLVQPGGMMDFREAILARMAARQGQNPNLADPRSLSGILSRGANVYSGGMPTAQTGGPNIGRPSMGQMAAKMNAGNNPISQDAIRRRLAR